MTVKKNILFLVATQPNNMGDLLINKLLIDELSKFGNIYLDIEGIPENFQSFLFEKGNVFSANKKYKASLKRFTSIKFFFKIKNDFDYFFKSPGPHGGIRGIRQFVDQIALSFIYLILSIKGIQLNLIGCEVIINNRLELLVEKFNNKIFHSYRVRTIDNLTKMSINGFNNIGYLPDLAFLLHKQIINRIPQRKVLISFRDMVDSNHSNDIYIFLKRSIDFFVGQGYEVHFAFQVLNDKSYNFQLYNQFKNNHVHFEKDCIWIDRIDYYNDFEFVLSNRLHVLLLGMLHNAIPLSLLDNQNKTIKISSTFRDLGLSDYIFDKKNNIPNYPNILKRKEIEVENIKEICKRNSALCEKYIKSIFQKNE